jgi:hypothetical protein
MVDVDVLVPRAHTDAAFDALERLGWQKTQDQPRNRMLAARHSENFTHPDGGAIDLHWVSSPLFAIPGDDQSADDAVRVHSRPLEVGGETVRMPAPADLLLHVIAHGCWIGSKATTQWAADAATVIAASEEEMAWDHVVEFARAHHLVPQVRDALTYLHTALDVPVPSGTLDDLRRQPVSVRDRRVHRALSGDTRAPAILGALPMTRARWVYRSAGWTRWYAARELPDYLRETWGLRNVRDVPLEAARKALRKLRGGSSTGR